VVVAVALAATTTGCGLGPGDSSPGTATLTVTRDYGAERVLEASESDPSESETVIRFLDREADITTRYGGGFVQSIDGTAGGVSGGRSTDWFFFVNGIESPRGSAEVEVRGGDRIWWDYRDWTAAISTPAVVGSWPEPFLQASVDAADRLAVTVGCLAPGAVCERVSKALADAGIQARVKEGAVADAGMRVLVGTWGRLRADGVADELTEEPATSGVFARFEPSGDGWQLAVLDPTGTAARTLGAGGGLVAGLRHGSGPVTWLVTGTDAAGVNNAAGLLDADDLGDHYAVATDGEAAIGVPSAGSG
jgi:Domain of unknown function (DUF4430)